MSSAGSDKYQYLAAISQLYLPGVYYTYWR